MDKIQLVKKFFEDKGYRVDLMANPDKHLENCAELADLLAYDNKPLERENEVREIAYIAWKGAANAHRMYPDNKHTFAEYWSAAKWQFAKYFQSNMLNK